MLGPALARAAIWTAAKTDNALQDAAAEMKRLDVQLDDLRERFERSGRELIARRLEVGEQHTRLTVLAIDLRNAELGMPDAIARVEQHIAAAQPAADS